MCIFPILIEFEEISFQSMSILCLPDDIFRIIFRIARAQIVCQFVSKDFRRKYKSNGKTFTFNCEMYFGWHFSRKHISLLKWHIAAFRNSQTPANNFSGGKGCQYFNSMINLSIYYFTPSILEIFIDLGYIDNFIFSETKGYNTTI